jgi:rRNA maturation protein Nop10
MKPPSFVLFSVDKQKPVEIIYGEERYTIEGECNMCGECCRKHAPPQFRKEDGSCKFLENNRCNIDKLFGETGDISKPWYCKLFPYDLECFKMLPEDCPLKLRRVC